MPLSLIGIKLPCPEAIGINWAEAHDQMVPLCKQKEIASELYTVNDMQLSAGAFLQYKKTA